MSESVSDVHVGQEVNGSCMHHHGHQTPHTTPPRSLPLWLELRLNRSPTHDDGFFLFMGQASRHHLAEFCLPFANRCAPLAGVSKTEK